jgi:hypothetical protein
MGIVQHAALHAQGQHIVWQQVFIKIKGYFPGHTLVKREKPTIIRCIAFKKVINDN